MRLPVFKVPQQSAKSDEPKPANVTVDMDDGEVNIRINGILVAYFKTDGQFRMMGLSENETKEIEALGIPCRPRHKNSVCSFASILDVDTGD